MKGSTVDSMSDAVENSAVCHILLESILEDALWFVKVWSAQCLNWPIVTRAHAPRQVILSCLSLKYKESANCRLEVQYSHQRGVDLIPLMMEVGYKPTGLLGLIIGTRLYFNFHPVRARPRDP